MLELSIFVLVGLVSCATVYAQTDPCASQPCNPGSTRSCKLAAPDGFLCLCDDLAYGLLCENNLLSGSTAERYNNKSGSFNSPSFPLPVENNIQLYYYIVQVPAALYIEFEFASFCTEENKDFLYYGAGHSPALVRFPSNPSLHGCYNETVPPNIRIEGDSAWFRFQSDANVNSEGFNITYFVDIDDCLSTPCQNDGTCSDEGSVYNCTCTPGYEGKNCETDVNECESSPCLNGATCFHGINVYFCVCTSGFNGPTCEIDICSTLDCMNGATCDVSADTPRCLCPGGFTGDFCEIEINECSSAPCMNAATCNDLIGIYTCDCPPGYGGVNCEILTDPCISGPCANGATCNILPDGYNCTCPEGFEGFNCSERVRPCDRNPCVNDTSNTVMCFNMPANMGYFCLCYPAYTGQHCENEIDECASGPCQNNGTCVDMLGAYFCLCNQGYRGDTCSDEVNECQSNPCVDGSTCIDLPGNYRCVCAPGLQGRNCDEDIDECENSPCRDGATCVDLMNDYMCICENGFTDQNCSTNINECEMNPCQNGATCVDGLGTHQCLCTIGYTGSDCSEIDLCRVEGTWFNRFNDMIVLRETTAGRLEGEHLYFEEREEPALREPALLFGYANTSIDYPVVGFSSVRDGGMTIRSWTGQCHFCGGQEVLHTTWVETRTVTVCFSVDEENRIGRDRWTRYEQELAPAIYSP